MPRRILVLAPHPDDEVLGVGGTMARCAAAGEEVTVAILTRGTAPLFTDESVAQVRGEIREAHKILGVRESIFLDLPTAQIDTVPHHEVNRQLVDLFGRVRPQAVYVPFVGDIHQDHQLFALSAMVAARPIAADAPAEIYAYETLSETNWNIPYLTPGFLPNVFVDITDHLETKLQAMQCVASQMKKFPHERSIEALRALATLRGATVHRPAAEAFVLIRHIV